MTNMEILELLEKGDISVSRALFLIKRRNKRKGLRGKNKWLKIRIKDEKRNFKLYVPISLLRFGLSLVNLLNVNVNKSVKNNEEIQKAQKLFDNIDNEDIKRIIKVLKYSRKINIVEIKDGENLVIIGMV